MVVFYLESSALLKMYKSEMGSDTVTELYRGKRPDELFIMSQISVLEVATVMARLVKGKVIPLSRYDSLVGTFTRDLARFDVVVAPLHHGLVEDALRLLPKYPLRTADALQVATGLRALSASTGVQFVFVTADREIIETCTALRVPVLDPAGPGALAQLRALR